MIEWILLFTIFWERTASTTKLFMQLIWLILLCSLHAWVSFMGFTEAWMDAFDVDFKTGIYFTFQNNTSNSSCLLFKWFLILIGFLQNLFCYNLVTFSQILLAIDRRQLAAGFWKGELESNIRELNLDFRFKEAADRERCMQLIDKLRRERGIYPHPPEDCTPKCKSRGMIYLYGRYDITSRLSMFCSHSVLTRTSPLSTVSFLNWYVYFSRLRCFMVNWWWAIINNQ